MILEDQRVLHEDLERLEQAIADRILEDPKHIRDRLRRDHEISGFLTRIQDQSKRLIEIYQDRDGARTKEIQTISTGDPFDAFYTQLSSIKDFHRRYPNEPVENLERAYKRRDPSSSSDISITGTTTAPDIDALFTGEEGYGRFFDLTTHHEAYLNLPGVKGARRLTYLQYLDVFDVFVPPQCPIKRPDKMTDAYFRYVGALAEYLEGFMRRTRPLEDLDKLFTSFDAEFDRAWERDEVPGWTAEAPKSGQAAPATEGTGAGIWCADCQKEFTNDNVYKAHLSGKRHKKAAEARAADGEQQASNGASNGAPNQQAPALAHRLKERAVAEREFRIQKLVSAMQTERSDTRVNVERKAGMTERERAQELAALYAETSEPAGRNQDESDSDSEEKIYNPLKLPLAWDGKPIPFWLYKLHGLGVEFPCEICGGHVYMGRRAFDKHFSEAKHIYGLKCLGITNTRLFNEITGIEEALKLWDKLQREKRNERAGAENVVQMEDQEGNVMPEKVYWDLQKQGLL